jgi:hypothetical protein
VTEDVVVRVWADDAVKDEDPVLVDVALGARVVLAVPVQLGEVVEEEVREGEEEGDPDTLRVIPVVAEIRGDPDTVTVPALFDTVDDALGEPVDEGEIERTGVEERVFDDVIVFDEVILRVPVAVEVPVRVPTKVRVFVAVTLREGLDVVVAVSVFDGGGLRLTVAVAVGVFVARTDRVKEGVAVPVLLGSMDRVLDRVGGADSLRFIVFVEQEVAVGVFDSGADFVRLGEPEAVEEDLWDLVRVGDEEDVLDCVPEAVVVFVEVSVFEDVVDPVIVRD